MRQTSSVTRASAPLRIVIVDDSAVVRGFLTRWISACDDMEMVGAAANGLEAIAMIPAVRPDVVILDIEMPHMNGLEALPLIRVAAPNAAVIMSSRLTRRDAEIALLCLQNGAAEIIQKPSHDDRAAPGQSYQEELLDKVRSIARRGAVDLRTRRTRSLAGTAQPAPARMQPLRPARPAPAPAISLAPKSAPGRRPRAILVGASTGGPNACALFIATLKPLIAQAPVIIAQHMPPVFTRVFAEHLTLASGAPCREARNGEPLTPGKVYIAPGAHHILVAGSAVAPTLTVDGGPPVRFSRPSVDVLFLSARDVFAGDCVAVVLTGMGSDGLEGSRALNAAGACIHVQDEASSVVWGMPGAIARAGLACQIAPPAEIAAALIAEGADA